MDPRIVRYFADGYKLGYSQPNAEPGIPLDEPWITYYRQGVEAGRGVRRDADSQFEGPTIGPDPGGESWEHYRRRWRELLEPFYHQHMPHIEVEVETFEPLPVNVFR